MGPVSPRSFPTLTRQRWLPWERLETARVGILYQGLPVSELHRAFRRPDAELSWALGGMGPRLFFGRHDGPWVPYEPSTIDQNTGRPVFERPWPWCWGDEVWGVGSLMGHPCYLHLEDEDETELILLSALHSPHPADLKALVRWWALQSVGDATLLGQIPDLQIPR